MDFKNKVVVVTGAGSGIGEVTAILLSELGAQVVLVARTLENLKRVAAACKKPDGNEPLVIAADITQENEVVKIEKEVISRYGKVDVLFNIAGAILADSIQKRDLEKFDKMMALNLRSVYMMISQFCPHLIKSKGNIVNVSSISGKIMIKGYCGYSVSKAAVICLTEYAAAELAEKGVRVNCVNPGATKTKVFGSLSEQSDKVFETMLRKVPLGKPPTPREVAQTMAFLASNLCNNVTGVSLDIDGGQVLEGSSGIKK